MELRKIADRDVYDLDVSGDEGVAELEGDVWTVVFTNPDNGDKSSRPMLADQKTCTVTVGTGYTGTADVVVSDDAGNEIEDSVTFG